MKMIENRPVIFQINTKLQIVYDLTYFTNTEQR